MVSTSVVRFFLFERTSGLVLTFKNLCDNSPGTGLSQVLPKFEPFGSSFYHIFSNSRTSWTQFLNQVQFHVHITHSPMLKIM
jgi:hypothetical protein